MELELPILDGFGASSQINEHADKVNFKTEIVALKKTSNNSSNEKCFEHGIKK